MKLLIIIKNMKKKLKLIIVMRISSDEGAVGARNKSVYSMLCSIVVMTLSDLHVSIIVCY